MATEVNRSGRGDSPRIAAALLVAVACGVAILWWRFNPGPPQSGLQNPGDLINYFFPLKALAAARLAAGELPLWNPHICSGVPLLATLQLAVFYPGSWLAVVLPAEWAIPIVSSIECVLAGWFTALLFRAWGYRLLSAGLGGVLFVFACVLGQSFWPAEVSALVWMPWLLLCVEKLIARFRWGWWIGLVAGTALSWLAGFPQFAVYALYLIAPYTALRLFQHSDASASRGWVAVALLSGIALGLGVAAIQLLPTLELIGESQRGGPLASSEVEYLRMARLPIVLRNALNPDPKLLSFDFGTSMGYLGTATLVWIAAGLAAGFRNPLTWLLAAAAVTAALLSDGPDGFAGGLFRIYASLPTGDMFRTPERLRVIAFFCAIAIAMRGLDSCDASLPAGPRRWIILGAAAACTLVLIALGSIGIAWRATAALVLLGALALGHRHAAPIARAGVVVLVLFDLASATGPHGSLRSFPAEWSRTRHALGHAVSDLAPASASDNETNRREWIGDSRTGLRIRPLLLVPASESGYRISCYEPLVPSSWARLAAATDSVDFTLENLDPDRYATIFDVTSVSEIVRLRRADPDIALSELITELASDRSAYHRGDRPRTGLPKDVFAERTANEDALPRAYLIDRHEVRSPADTLDALVENRFDPHTTVLIDREPGVPAARNARPAKAVRITHYAPERVEIELTNDGAEPIRRDRWLVLTDTDFPGWLASIDGEATPIYRANGLYRAVRVPVGARRASFTYAPRSLRIGSWVSAVSLAALIAIPLAARARSRDSIGAAKR
ncbi:MAG: hypothetical protein AAEJ52_18935 [Myxococcota bacterium]